MKDYASIAEPLTELTKKSLPEKVEWSSNAQLAFDRLKQMLVSAPLMRNPTSVGLSFYKRTHLVLAWEQF